MQTRELSMLATKQWGSRPDDERFWSVEECMAAATEYRRLSVELPHVDEKKLRVEAQDGDLMLVGKGNVASSFSNWAFSQMSKALKVPEGFVSELPATLAAQVINHRLSVRAEDESLGTNLLFYSNGHHVVRAFTSAKYGRVWDTEVLSACTRLTDRGWKVPPARPMNDGATRKRLATEDDVIKAGTLSLSIKVGDEISPAGVYRGDRDLFVVLIDDNQALEIPGQSPLFRGAIFRNSEVGASYWEVYFFLLNGICGNHILHGVQGIKYVRTPHVGSAEERAAALFNGKVIPYANAGWADTYGKVKAAQSHLLGPAKAEMITDLFEKGIAGRATLEAAFKRAEEHEGWYSAPPLSAWGMSNGLTELAQETPHADKRMEAELAGAKVLEMAF